ncbi:V-type ATPase subunit [Deinococcus radiotolerans]|uniref:V-type ATP synthase subunit C n=1 Tax=Deinococcus radiotolerans TaxID=1309407 RepID=A0ABQ2FJN8_9DEIO|nr:V-type ATPase subunit [Deinococcus radiotolerans]GGL01585.1 v-type ATP synthase subunit C [Deinococcus radiotolerans]
MNNPYGYINGRVRMMRTALVEARSLDEAASSVNYQEFLRQISETPLREDLGDATAQGAGLAQLDEALSRNYLKAIAHLRSIAVGQPAREIESLLLRYDLQNVKTLVRGVLTGRSADDIVGGLIPAGTVPWSVLQGAAQSADVASLAQTLAVAGGKLGQILRSAVSSGASSLLDLEVALDQGYYRAVLAGVRGTHVRRYFTREIDIRNLLIARQLRGSAANVRYFIPGGRDVTESDFLRLAGGDNAVAADLQPIAEAADLGTAEAVARRLLDEASRNVAMADALGPGVALDYLRRKEQEIARLRLIGRAKFYGLSKDELVKELQGA